MNLSHITTIVALALASSASLQAQEYFWFDDGGSITPAEGTVDQLDKLIIDYSHCKGTDEGLNIGNGKGNGWITSNVGTSHNVTFSDDYTHHQLTLTITDGPIAKAGDYKLTIPEGAFNVYGNASLINDAVSYYWTVSGVNDVETPMVHLISSTPAEGEVMQLPVEELTLTFDQDITVSHSVFDAAGLISNVTSGGYIQLNMKAEGNTLTLTKGSYSSSDFYAGQQYELELYGGHIKAAVDPSIVYSGSILHFSIASEDETDGLKVMAQIPAAGENIHNAGSVTFNRNLSSVDKTKVSLVNEQGHVVTLSTVGRDSESPKSLIFNISPDTHLQGGTTYTLHLEAGAVTSGEYTNEEMDAAYWCIPAEQFSLSAELANATVEEFQTFTLMADIDASSSIIVKDALDKIKVTGVSTNADHVYANLIDFFALGNTIQLTFDQNITPALLAEGGAIYNSVKVVIPAGVMTDEQGQENRHTEFIVYVIEDKEIGPQTWTFNPADGEQLNRLGNPWYGEDEEGNRTTYYNISFEVSGENVFARILDGTKLSITETISQEVVRTFGRNDVIGYNNKFSLELGEEAITADGVYQLQIPASAINLYSDPDCRTNPIHPVAYVTATWTVGTPDLSIEKVAPDAPDTPVFDLMGRQVSTDSPAIIIRHRQPIINR